MNYFSFLRAKFSKEEESLLKGTLTKTALLQSMAHKSIAIVGNARALSKTNCGGRIDAADIVIRINSAPIASAESHGTKTLWIAVSTPISNEVIEARDPSLVLWMTNKLKRFPARLHRRGHGIYLNRRGDRHVLAASLGTSPTTGLMMIDLAASSDACAIDLYGFDFFASLSLSGRRTAEQVPHDFQSEHQYVDNLIARDPRITLHAMK